MPGVAIGVEEFFTILIFRVSLIFDKRAATFGTHPVGLPPLYYAVGFFFVSAEVSVLKKKTDSTDIG